MPDLYLLEDGEKKTERDFFQAGLLAQVPPHTSARVNTFDAIDIAGTMTVTMGLSMGLGAAGLALYSASASAAIGAAAGAAAPIFTSAAVASTATGGASAAISTAVTWAGIAGGIAGVAGGGFLLGNAIGHERVLYIVVQNPTNECFKVHESKRKVGNLTAPNVIPPHSTCGIVLHHSGPELSGHLHYRSDRSDLFIGGTNPFWGCNKIRVEHHSSAKKKNRSLDDFYNDVSEWGQTGGDIPLQYLYEKYDNPSAAFVRLKTSKTEATQVDKALSNIKEILSKTTEATEAEVKEELSKFLLNTTTINLRLKNGRAYRS